MPLADPKRRAFRTIFPAAKSPIQLLENIKLLSFWLVKAKNVAFHYSFHFLCQNPFVCAGIG
jgi:hypothetical protein